MSWLDNYTDENASIDPENGLLKVKNERLQGQTAISNPVLTSRQKIKFDKQWIENQNLQKDQEEFRKTGFVKNARSASFRKQESDLKNKQTFLSQNNQTDEERATGLGNRKLLLYEANPAKIIGDILPYQIRDKISKSKYIPDFPTTELDRQKYAKEVKTSGTRTFSENMIQSLKDGLAEVPDAAINIALGGVNPEKGIINNFIAAADPFGITKSTDKFVAKAVKDISIAKNATENFFKFNPNLPKNPKVKFLLDDTTEKLFSKKIEQITNNEVDYLTSPEYLKTRMKNTGESKEVVNNEINKMISLANKTTIRKASAKKLDEANAHYIRKTFSNFIKPIDGNYIPSFNVNAQINYKNIHNGIEDIEHEILHSFSPVFKENYSKSYKNYPKLELENPLTINDKNFKEAEKHIKYLQLPHEQQVRFGKIKSYMQETYGIKKGTPFTNENTQQFFKDVENGNFSKRKYDDVHDMLQYVKIPKEGKISFTNILNKAWGTTGIAVGLDAATKSITSKKDSNWLDKYK